MTTCCDTGNSGGFINVDSWDHFDYANELEFNTKLWFNSSMMGIGAWENVGTGVPNCSSTLYTLTPITEPNPNVTTFSWGVPKKGLVWETASFGSKNTQPVQVYHNNTLETGFDIDYDNGIFTHATDLSGTLTANYSYRSVQSYVSNAASWWYEILSNTYDLDENVIWSVFRKNGVQLPSVIIEAGPVVRQNPIQLGTTIKRVDREVSFYILANNDLVKNKLAHILTSQLDNAFTFFDTNTAEFPIQCGNKLVNSNTYEDIVLGAPWKCVQVVDVSEAHIDSPCSGLDLAKITLTFRMDNPVKGTTTPAP